jgi:adenylate cyclase class 2
LGKNGVEVTIDTWPGLAPFVEVEGKDEEEVRSISIELGFDFEKAIFGSIDLIYESVLGIAKEKIIKLPEITFSNPPKIT